MLTYLRVKNLALVDDLSIEPGPECNIITGETGAGKSVLMGALGLALGLRGDKGMIRTGMDQAVVEAVFDVHSMLDMIAPFLEEKGIEPCEEGMLRVKRSMSAVGANHQFINGTPVSVSILAALGDELVDIHGPNEHQSLLYPLKQLQILDSFCCARSDSSSKKPGENYHSILLEYKDCLKKLRLLESKRKELVVDEQVYRQQLDMLRYQVKEIESAGVDAENDSLLEDRYTRAAHAADILKLIQSGMELLSEEDNSILSQCGMLGKLLQDASRLDPKGLEPILEQQEILNSQLYELQSAVSGYVDKVDLDPQELQQMEERLNLLSGLKRKYGRTVQDVLKFGEEAREKLEQLENRDAELAELNLETEKEYASLLKKGERLTASRKKYIPALEKEISSYLKELGFNRGFFKIQMEPLPQDKQNWKALENGPDRVEFLFAPNPGEPPKPLKNTASSGEIARVMLALKTALAEADSVPVLVFDEVDANIGGETALAVGKMMRKIGRKRQLFCITHLAPVAASGSTHFRVEKTVKNNKTYVQAHQLDKGERVEELSRMLGGHTDAARKYAKTLLADQS
ncbi:MAG: DNA repair protein RecN [Verrucomicrobia bacterium]|nr:DNA repair protein RecN [Verrucomicrobiota bacterium]